ncbi:hypothetical protein ABFS82_01G020600 [Erythranthe guttata]|uniref:Exostosin GT47 domain-containing protein n=1 Tax=Erythranthe guttata TaxID=4155 RepID=A0A022PY95_ERYGU|nr:PREDICTED: probable glycosyltransferase At3g07620 isoform X2 [Erythranthe guttata]EYU20439.1 hypothetical protein MIMGU_mgv1a003679mg [Erythranthe guttata]|eukprot:XP_012857825.1 PREDICTED: probable glycosyltransferase At3g07620 isoform X2 [Erythranthe guttata]
METRRLLWLMALLFSLVLLVQYIELPYGYVLSSFLSFTKSRSNSAKTNHARDSSVNITSSSDEHVVRNKSSTPELAPVQHGYNVSIPKYISSKNSSSVDLQLTNAAPTNTKKKDRNSQTTIPQVANMVLNNEKPKKIAQSDLSASVNSSFVNGTSSKMRRRFKGPPSRVVPMSEMNHMLTESRLSFRSVKPRWPSEVDKELLNARTQIESAQIVETSPHIDVSVYRNFSSFLRSYDLMEKTLKIYVYAEGEKPVFHQPELSGIYASEGWFMKQLEENKHFITKNPQKAHLFYLPFSSHLLQQTLYVPNSHSRKNLVRYLSNYLKTITKKHPFWNRTDGADHFLAACHDWAPAETSRIMKNCIRALCNADVSEGFHFSKDVSIPETYVRHPTNPLKDIGGKPPSQRKILAFFAGKLHGYLRPILLNHWENKDPDMKISGKLQGLKGNLTYIEYMKSSKYCISAKGYEAYTPRVVEAIFYECVPVIISDNFVPPFFETLNWESFAVFVMEKDIPNLKNILLAIPKKRYVEMQERVRGVQKHFLWHRSPVKYDVFHMILHSVWYNRVFQMTDG